MDRKLRACVCTCKGSHTCAAHPHVSDLACVGYGCVCMCDGQLRVCYVSSNCAHVEKTGNCVLPQHINHHVVFPYNVQIFLSLLSCSASFSLEVIFCCCRNSSKLIKPWTSKILTNVVWGVRKTPKLIFHNKMLIYISNKSISLEMIMIPLKFKNHLS